MHENVSPWRDTRAVILLLFIGVVLAWPALRSPFFLDDYLHAAMTADTFPVHRSAFDLYDFIDDASRDALFQRGLLPWWSNPHVTIRFFRPLSSVMLYGDHRVFGSHPFPMHLHSLAWWMFAVLSVRALFRRVFDSPRVAFMATAIFALAPCHAVPLAWLANREVLVAITFGALALASYMTWRKTRSPRAAIAATLLFSLSLLAGGEYAITFGGYVVAFDFVRAREKTSLTARVFGWMPFLVPAGAYVALRHALHYGAAGSGFYSDPFADPARFSSRVPTRLVTLLADAWLSLDTIAWFSPWERAGAVAIVLAAAIIGAFVTRHALAAFSDDERARIKWLVFGSLLSLVPVLAVVASTRLLGVAMLGVAPLIAAVLERAWFRADESAREKTSAFGVCAALLAFAHLVHGPATLWLDATQIREDAAELAWRADAIEGRVQNAPNPNDAQIGIVRGTAGMFFAPFALDDSHRAPKTWRFLAQARHVLVLRVDEKTIELVAGEDQSLFPEGELSLYRSEDAPLAVGSELRVPGVRAMILEVGKRGPRRARLVFDENPDLLTWLTDDREAMIDAELPKIGFGKPFSF